jgi:hypothetical protein
MTERCENHPGPPEDEPYDPEIEAFWEEVRQDIIRYHSATRLMVIWRKVRKWWGDHGLHVLKSALDLLGVIGSAGTAVDAYQPPDSAYVVSALDYDVENLGSHVEAGEVALEGGLERAAEIEESRLADAGAELYEMAMEDQAKPDPYEGPDQVEIGDKDEPKDS